MPDNTIISFLNVHSVQSLIDLLRALFHCFISSVDSHANVDLAIERKLAVCVNDAVLHFSPLK